MSKTSKKVYNPATCELDTLTKGTCPRCHGFGANTGDDDGCPICNGYGFVWANSYTGLVMAPYQRAENARLY